MILLFRIGLSLAILFFAFRNVDFSAVLERLAQLDALSPLIALVLCTASTLLAATRWRLVASAGGQAPPHLSVFVRSFYRGAFVNQGLPTTLGGDALRVIDLASGLGGKRKAFDSVLLDRVLGLAGLLIINALMLPLSLQLLPPALALAVGIVSAGSLLAIAAVLLAPWQRIAKRFPLLSPLAERTGFGRRIVGRPSALLWLCALSVAVHVCAILAMFVLARQFGITADLWTHLTIQPSVFVAATLPVSLAGWGIREGSMAAMFGSIGVAAPAVMATSLTYGAVAFASTAPGLAFLLAGHRRTAS